MNKIPPNNDESAPIPLLSFPGLNPNFYKNLGVERIMKINVRVRGR